VHLFGVAIRVSQRKCAKLLAFAWQKKSSFLLSAFLRGSGTKCTGDLILPCLEE
jgi:hypothetical protein